MIESLKEKLAANNELYLRLKIRPAANKTEVKGWLDDDTLKMDVAAVPEKGKANAELIKYLAREFEVGKDDIRIISGASDKIKLIKIIK